MLRILTILLSTSIAISAFSQEKKETNTAPSSFFLPVGAKFFQLPFFICGKGTCSHQSIADIFKVPANELLLTGYEKITYDNLTRRFGYRYKRVPTGLAGMMKEVEDNETYFELIKNSAKYDIDERIKDFNKLQKTSDFLEKFTSFNDVCAIESNLFQNVNCQLYSLANNFPELNVKPDLDTYRRLYEYNENHQFDIEFSDIKYNPNNEVISFRIFDQGINKFIEYRDNANRFKKFLEVVKFKKYTIIYRAETDKTVTLLGIISNNSIGIIYNFPIKIVVANNVGIDNYKEIQKKYDDDKKLKAMKLQQEQAQLEDERKQREKAQIAEQKTRADEAKREKESPEYIYKMSYANYLVIANYCRNQITRDVLSSANDHMRKIENRLVPRLSRGQTKESLQMFAASVAQSIAEFGSVLGGQAVYCPTSFKNLEEFSRNLK